MKQAQHIPALDGLRGIAIIAVMAYHFMAPGKYVGWAWWWIRILGLGWWGVDLFFALSGFLITGILLDAKQAGGSLFNFYMRRVLRIFPLHYTVLALVFTCYAIAPSQLDPYMGDAGKDQVWWWCYSCNLLYSIRNAWSGGFIAHFWTLAIEEQFYMLWPVAVLVLCRRRLMLLCGGLMIFAFFFRMWAYNRFLIPGCFVSTPARMDALCAGAWLAAAMRETQDMAKLMRTIKLAGIAAGACLGLLLWEHGLQMDVLLKSSGLGGISALAVFSMALVAWGATANNWFLSMPWLRFFGRYSYGLYVLHCIIQPFHISIYTMQRHMGYGLATAVYFLSMFMLSVLAAYTSYWLFERHFLKLKTLFPTNKPSFVFQLAR